MTDAGSRTARASVRSARCRLFLLLVVAGIVSFAAGYGVGMRRHQRLAFEEGRRQVAEFLRVASDLGIIDEDRLRELAGADAGSAGDQEGEP